MSRVPRPSEHLQRTAAGQADQAGQANEAGQADQADQAGPPGSGQGSVESLYPLLFDGVVDASQIVAEARSSTLAKAREIIDLRAYVGERSSGLLASCAQAMAARFGIGGRLLTFGNGGSATDAADLATLFLYPPAPPGPPGPHAAPALAAISLVSDVSVLTALANDVGVEVMFARQIVAFGRAADIVVGLSTSGNSENLLRAFDEANRLGLMTIGISGYDGGKMAQLASLDYLFIAPSESIHRIQEAQTTIYHILWELVVAELGRHPVIT
jgi:D-sedoheptulose 7-phosphate isomerase